MQVQLFSVLEVSYFHFSLQPTQTLVLYIYALKVKYKCKQTRSTKVSRNEVRLLSEGVTKGFSVRLTCRSMHFHSSDPVVAIPPLN